MPPPHPTLQAAVVCDQAIQEAGTGKYTLVGTFARLLVVVQADKAKELKAELKAGKSIPHPQLGVYFCVSGAQGKYGFSVQLAKLDTFEERVLGILGGELEAKDRLAPLEFAVNFKGMGFPGFGRYVFKLMMNGREVGSKPFDVVRVVQEAPDNPAKE